VLLSNHITGQGACLVKPLIQAAHNVRVVREISRAGYRLIRTPCEIIEAYGIIPLIRTARLVRMARVEFSRKGSDDPIQEMLGFPVRWLKTLLCIMLVNALVTVPGTWAENSRSRKTMIDPCPNTPNCVSSLAPQGPRRMAPIPYQGSLEAARKRLMGIIGKSPRATVVQSTATYVKVEFRSKIFSFIDDVEFEFHDGSKLIHFRSASRTGYYDFGVNRRRMEAMSREFASE
jgi:uncharacterized protein (DUF1499 family)